MGSTGTAEKTLSFCIYFRLVYGSYPLRIDVIRDDSYCSSQSLREIGLDQLSGLGEIDNEDKQKIIL